MSRSRGWCFTINNPTEADKTAVKDVECQYVVCGEEVGEQGTPHLQGYVYWKNQRSFKTLQKLFPRANLEAAKGTGQQNRTYCTKDGTVLVEKGDCPQDPKDQGASGRALWDEVKAHAQAGTEDEIESKIYVTQYSAIMAIKKAHMRNKESLPGTTGEWWSGPSGSGKSRKARETYPDAYIKGLNKWWDGYRDQEVVIIEDIDKYNVSMGGDLKRWLDHYSFPAESKGGGMNIRPKRIIITSQYEIDDIWEDFATTSAMKRRCVMRIFPEVEANAALQEPAGNEEEKKEDAIVEGLIEARVAAENNPVPVFVPYNEM